MNSVVSTFAFLMIAFAFALPAHADDSELDRLRDAVQRGEVMPLSELQAHVHRVAPGEIVKVELEEDEGKFIYEFKVLQANGRLVEIEMDARDARVLDVDNDDD